MKTALPLRMLLPVVALLALPACNLGGLQVAVGSGPSYGGYGGGYGGYAAPSYGYGYSAPGYGYGYGAPVYRRMPRQYYSYIDRSDRRYARWGSPYANNGRCDDARYETSNGGRAAPGTDERDCRRFGHGLK